MATADDSAAPSVTPSGHDSSAGGGELLDRLDLLLAGLVVLFAFMAALFPARNSDFLQQLATGRLIAHGEYTFGSDPFSAAGDKTGWVNHSWLFALLMYLVYQLPSVGPAAVVVFKALLMAALTVLMLRLSRRPGQRWYVPALVTALAVLTISSRMLLQPLIVSFFLLGVTLYLLERPRRLRELGRSDINLMSWWALPIICALWVNFDQWFILGPVTIALYLAGELIQQEKDNRAGLLGAVMGASLFACLVNPFHVRALTLPAQLGFSEGMEILHDDPAFRGQSLSPVQRLYFDPHVGRSAAGLAYFPLALLGMASFGMSWGSFPWWRATVWLGFLLLSLVHARAIPFFAIVAGPITVMNILDFVTRRAAQTQRPAAPTLRKALFGRMASLLIAVALIAASALGLLQAQPQDSRRLGVGVSIDGQLKKAAETLGESATGEAVAFNTAPEVVHYLSWFGGGARGFMDARLPQFPEAARAYVAAKKSLSSDDVQEPGQSPSELTASEPAYRDVFRRWHVNGVLLYSVDPLRQITIVEKMIARPGEWTLTAVEGGSIGFRWHDPQHEDVSSRPDRPGLDLNARAFGSDVKPLRPDDSLQQPSQDWWTVLLHGDPPRSPESGTAASYLALFVASRAAYQAHSIRLWEAASRASLVAGAGSFAGPLANGSMHRAFIDSLFFQDFLQQSDDGPPAALYLAIRAARHALAENPNDSRVQLILGEAYIALSRQTRERVLASPFLQILRNAQAVACFQQALASKDLDRRYQEMAHVRLAELYQRQFHDLRLHHLTRQYELASESGEPTEKLEELKKRIDNGRAFVKNQQDRYELDSASRHPAQKAQIAMQYGLAERADEELQKVAKEDPQGKEASRGLAVAAGLSLRLLVGTGRIAEARELLATPLRRMLGTVAELQIPAGDWYQLVVDAVVGDMSEADRTAAEIRARMLSGAPMAISLAIGQCLLVEGAKASGVSRWPVTHLLPSMHPQVVLGQTLQRAHGATDLEASLALLRAELALEAGAVGHARTESERVLAASAGHGAAKNGPVVLHPQHHAMARMYLQWLTEK